MRTSPVALAVTAALQMLVVAASGSVALFADGLTSLAVLAGAGGVALGFPLADPIVGLVITLAILAVLRTAVRDVCRRLMDAVAPSLVDRAETVLRATPGITAVPGVRMRWIGHSSHTEADLDIQDQMTVVDAHRLAHEAERRLVHAVPRVRTTAIHAYPATQHDLTAPWTERLRRGTTSGVRPPEESRPAPVTTLRVQGE